MCAKRQQNQKDTRDWSVDYADGGVIEKQLDAEIKDSMRSYIDYALTERALPYIDGLKPVHRAILWSMWESNIKSNSNYVKSAKVASDVIGAYHPHSQDAVYGAAAGMTRSKGDDSRVGACKLNSCLIDGRGNFGASFEDSPGAPRYTEMRLSKAGEACVRETGSSAVFMKPTFDAKHTLPEIMPVRLPLLLINGSVGLAYGYNVSWLPHNPSEALDACIMRIDNPKCSIDDVKKVMPGPDFPSGGVIIDQEEGGIRDAYDTGFGSVLLTSRYNVIRNATRSRHFIDFYETPYGVNRSGDNSIVEGIATFASKYPEYGIVDVKNLSGMENECLIEVSVKSSVNPDAVVAALLDPSSGTKLTQTLAYRQSAVIGRFTETDVSDATGRSGMLRLVSPKPCDMSLLDYLDAFIDFRHACVMNSSRFEIEKAKHRRRMIDGLLKALLDIDEVIAIVRKSRDADTAKKNLMRAFKLDDEQASYVLSIPLSRLTRSDRIQLESNSKKLGDEIKRLEKIISSRKSVLTEVRRQLEEEKSRQTVGRRSAILAADGKYVPAVGETKEATGTAKAAAMGILHGPNDASALDEASEDSPAAASASSIEVSGTAFVYTDDSGRICQSKKHPSRFVCVSGEVDVNDTVLIVFDDGSSVRMKVYELPAKPMMCGRKSVGFMVINGSVPLSEQHLGLATSDGLVKVLKIDTLTKALECPVISLNQNARLLAAAPVDDSTLFTFVASNANLLKFTTSSVNPQGRTSFGVAGIKLVEGSSVVWAGISKDTDTVVTMTNQSIKATPLEEYPAKGRGSQGVRCHRFLKGENGLTHAFIGTAPAADGVSIPKMSARDSSGTKETIGKGISFSNVS